MPVVVVVLSVFAAALYGAASLWVGQLASVAAWVLLFGVLSVGFRHESRLRMIAQIAYLVATAVGLVIVRDNMANFYTPFSGGHDDSEYFYNVIAWLSGGDYDLESPVFQLVNGAWGYFLTLVTFRSPQELTLLDFLPLNWFVAAACVAYIDKLARLVCEQDAPLWVILIPVVLNHNFINNAVRFYRDVYIAALVVFVVYATLQSKYVRGLVATLLLGILRGGNGIIMAFFMAVTAWTRRVTTSVSVKRVYTISLVVIAVSFFTGLNQYGDVVFAAVSKYTNVERRLNAFEGMTYGDLLENRMLNKALRGGNEGRIEAVEQGGVRGFVYKLGYSVAFPLRMHGPRKSEDDFNSLYGPVTSTVDGFFIYNLVRWIFVWTWLLVAPLLAIGVYVGWEKNETTTNLVAIYLITLLAVSQLSFQLRHTMTFVVFHPVLATLGYNEMHRFRKQGRVIARLAALAIIGYNVLGLL